MKILPAVLQLIPKADGGDMANVTVLETFCCGRFKGRSKNLKGGRIRRGEMTESKVYRNKNE
jgi:hypothetical protein